MNVTCPNCATIYRVDPAKVPEAGVRARCAACNAVFAVRRDAQQGEAAPATAQPVGVPRPAATVAPTRPAAAPSRPEPPKPPEAPPPAAEPTRPAAAATAARPPGGPSPAAPGGASPRPAAPPAPSAPPRPAAPARPAGAAPVAPARAAAPAAPVSAPPPASPPRPAPAPSTPAASKPVAPAGTAPSAPSARPTPASGGRPTNPFLSQDPSLKAKRLARALISDMVVYHPGKRQEGLRDGNLKELFEEEIKKSWEEYAEQVGREVAESTAYFREALNEILAGGRQIF